jgi:hypothetical protein
MMQGYMKVGMYVCIYRQGFHERKTNKSSYAQKAGVPRYEQPRDNATIG